MIEPAIKIKVPLAQILDRPKTYINKWLHRQQRKHQYIYIVKQGINILYVGITSNTVRHRLLMHMSRDKYKLGKYLNSLSGDYSEHNIEIRVFPRWLPNTPIGSPVKVHEYQLIRRWMPPLNTAGVDN